MTPALTDGEPQNRAVVIGAALLKGINPAGSMKRLDRLGVTQAINRSLKHQPEVPTIYRALVQVVIQNRLRFQPLPIYQLGPWD